MEFVTNNYSINGLPANVVYQTVDHKAFQLLSIVNASMASHKYEDLKESLLYDYERFEISRLLIEIAVIVRNDLETLNSSFEGQMYNPKSPVGTLIAERKKPAPLSFLEACNKIIHACHINFDMEEGKSLREYKCLNPKVFLYGALREKDWKAELDIVRFVQVVVHLS